MLANSLEDNRTERREDQTEAEPAHELGKGSHELSEVLVPRLKAREADRHQKTPRERRPTQSRACAQPTAQERTRRDGDSQSHESEPPLQRSLHEDEVHKERDPHQCRDQPDADQKHGEVRGRCPPLQQNPEANHGIPSKALEP